MDKNRKIIVFPVWFWLVQVRDNDQSRAKDILSIATEKDLIIRDLGYFVLDCFEEMSIKNMSFLSRLRIGVTIYNSKTGQEINLMKELKQKGCFDQTVLLGRKQKLAVRLIALKVTQEQANLRRKKAKEDRDIRVNHSKEYYKMLDYQLFITTEGKDQFKPRQIAQIYNLRWRIESIFKCWKSHFHLQRLIPQDRSLTKERVETIVYLMLLFIVLFQVYIYQLVLLAAEKKENCIISLSKLCKYIAHHIHSFFEQPLKSLMPEILYYCRYDKRYDRKNYVQKVKLS